MLKLNWLSCVFLILGLGIHLASAQKGLTANNGHSHNDYKQRVPLLTAYNAGMGSIEADVFLRKGKLYVAHDSTEIRKGKTLKRLYLEPLQKFYRLNNDHPYQNETLKLQLVIDIKQDYAHVLPELLKEIKNFKEVFDWEHNKDAIRLVISGEVPPAANFKDYSSLLSFDGRPNIAYSADQLKRIAMISDVLKNYTTWNGTGNPVEADEAKLKALINKVHDLGKPFRFWGTLDSSNTWIVLERLGVDWINTDQPAKLKQFLLDKGN
jgi:alkaline phosphatase